MRGSLSPETIIRDELQALGCSPRNFCRITGFSYGNFAAIMAGSRDFEKDQAERLREKLTQMKSLVEEIGLIPDWSRSDAIANALMTRLVAQVAAEMHDPGTVKFEQYAKDAEQFVK